MLNIVCNLSISNAISILKKRGIFLERQLNRNYESAWLDWFKYTCLKEYFAQKVFIETGFNPEPPVRKEFRELISNYNKAVLDLIDGETKELATSKKNRLCFSS
jgi:hypothetical protein